MTATTVKLLDIVALTVDKPEYNLWRGQVGTVVEVLAGGAAFEVEFSVDAERLAVRHRGGAYLRVNWFTSRPNYGTTL